jgi:small conductance mechanosensitive channel
VSYKEDLIELEKKIPNILNEIYEKHQDIFISEPKYIGVQDFQKTGLILRFTAEVDEKDIYSGRRILNREIYVAFVEQGTVMAHE